MHERDTGAGEGEDGKVNLPIFFYFDTLKKIYQIRYSSSHRHIHFALQR